MQIIKQNSSFFEILGSYLKGILFLLFPFNFLLGDAPDWSVNSGDYSSNLSMIGSFYYNEESFDGLNMVGAFDTNGEVRGVATGTVYGTDYLYLITIYGNNAVEEINFKAWIAAEDTVLAVTESIQFVPDGTIGTLASPEIFNVYSNYDFVPVLSGIPDQSIHMGEEFVDIYLNDYLTVGDDDAIIFSTSQGTNIQVSQSGDQIEFSPSENWIGTESIIFTATELTNNGYYATDTASFTVLKEDNAPSFSPIPNQIIGSNGTFATVDLLEYLTELDEDSLSFSVSYGLSVDEDEYPDWSVNSLDYEFSMNAVVSMKSRNEVVEGTNHLLGAFDSNGNLRGVTNGVAYGDGWLYLITIYSNATGDEINFRFYDNSIQRNIPIQEGLYFENDGVLGTPSFPITFNASFVNAQVTTEGLVTLSRTDESWYGTDSLIFEAMDNGTLNNYTDSDTITLTVQGGFAPLLSGIPNQSINVGSYFSPIDLSNYLQTFDEDEILWSFSGNVDLNISLTGSVVNIEVDNSWGGSEDIVFTATDNNAIALASSDTVTFTVVPLDNPPVLSNIPDQSIFIDEEFNSIDLTDYLTELDGDELSWSYRFLSHPSETNNPLWTLVPSNFSYSMNIVAEVEALGETKETSEHRLAAIDQNGQTVGVAQGSSYQDTWIYNLTIYSNELDPDINLYFYDSDAQRVLLVDMDLSFIDGQQLGSPFDPYLLRAGPFFLDISQTGVLSFEILQKHWEFAESIRLTVMDKNTDNNYSYFYDVSFAIENRTPSLVLENQTINEGEQFQSIFLDQYISDDGTTFDSLLVNVTVDSIYTVELINDTLLTIYSPQDENWHGVVPVTFSVTDHHPYYPETLNSDVLFIMLPVNDAPVIEQASNQTVSEDELSTFVMEVADVDTGTTFTLSAVTDTNSVHVISNSDNYTITTFQDAHWHGQSEITVFVSDGELLDTTSFVLTVEPVNDAPIIAQAEDQTINEDTQGVFSFEVSDIDTGTTLTLSAISDTDAVSIEANSLDFSLSITPEDNWHGQTEITVFVSDGELSDTTSFLLTVDPINDSPIISDISDTTISENTSLHLDLVLIDVDTAEVFTIFATSDSPYMSVSASAVDSSIIAIPDEDWHGTANITVIVSDGELSDSETFSISVSPANDAPIIAQAEDQTINEDTQGVFSFQVSDIDTGTTLILSAISDTDAVSIEANSLDFSLSITPEDNWHGQTEITVFVSDGELSDTTLFTLTVLPVNDEPVIAFIPDVVIDEDSIFVLPLEITDIDTGEIFTLIPSTNSSSVVVLSNNQDSSITIIPDENWHGTATITIVVSDGELSDSKIFQLIVDPVNDAPLIMDAQNQTILEDSIGLFSFEVSDIDTGSILTFSALSDTNALSLVAESENYTIQAFPSQDWHGSAQITAVISDGILNDSTSFSLIVSPLNDSPIINDINDQSIPEDGSGIFSFEISDVDTGETLLLGAYSDISSVNVEASSIDTTVTVYGEENWYGESTISVVVSDGELSDTTNFNLSVYPTDSDPPTIVDIEDQILLEDQNSIFFFDVADIDTGQTLTLSAFSDTSAVNLLTNSESFSVSTLLDTNWHGEAEITVIVSDGFLSDSTSFNLFVQPVNDALIISAIGDTSILENSIFEIMPEITDVDTGEVFNLIATSSDSSIQLEIDQLDLLIRCIPDDNWHGLSNMLIIASDGELLDTTSFILTVNPVNDAPVISNMENQNINEDEQGIFDFEVSDVDTGQTLVVTAFSDTSAVAMQVNLESLSVIANLETNWFGSSSILVEVSDGLLADSSSFILTVNPVNDAPIISSIQDTSILEDTTVDISIDVMDVDSFENLTLEVFSDTNSVSCTVLDEGFIVNIIPDPNWYGQTIIHAVISDGEFSDTTNFHLNVEYVSDQPIAALGDDLICMQGQQVRIDGSNSYDIDNESLSYIWMIENVLQDTVRLSNPFLSFEAPVVDISQSYVVKLQVENENGLQSNIDSILLTVDLIEVNDIFSENNQTEVNPGEDIPIEVQFPQYFDVDSISLNYSTAFSGFLSESMETQGSRSGSTYSANIPFHDVGIEGLAYFIYAKDQNGSEIVTDTVDISMLFKPGTISSDMTYSPFQDGFPKDIWRMISIPSYVKSNSISDLFYSQLGGNSSNEKWRIYEYGRFEGTGVWNFPDTLKPGKGYWLKQLVADNPHFTLDSGKTIELTGFDIELLSGWNIISSPYLFPVNVEVDPPYFPQLFIFGHDSLEGWIDSSITRMMPWTAYATFNSLESRTLRLLPLNEPNQSLTRETGAPSWNVQIIAQSGQHIDGISRFGVHSRNESFGDSLNIPKPPLMEKHVSISSFQKNRGKLLELAQDFRAQSDSIVVWDLKLVSNIKATENKLTFNVEGQLGNKLLKFVDMQNGSTLDLRLENGKILQLPSYVGSSQYQFKLLYGSQEQVENKLTEILAMIPEKYHLGNNYPNPFNPSTIIPFAISSPGNVYLTIYDLRGREVKRLLRDYLQVGYHSANWDGQNELGISVSSGVYYYELRTSKFRSVKKMVLIK